LPAYPVMLQFDLVVSASGQCEKVQSAAAPTFTVAFMYSRDDVKEKRIREIDVRRSYVPPVGVVSFHFSGQIFSSAPLPSASTVIEHRYILCLILATCSIGWLLPEQTYSHDHVKGRLDKNLSRSDPKTEK
jgi:hypothetical protein